MKTYIVKFRINKGWEQEEIIRARTYSDVKRIMYERYEVGGNKINISSVKEQR